MRVFTRKWRRHLPSGRLRHFTFSQAETLYQHRVKELNFPPETEPLPLADVGHRFRGAFLDKCGVVERWATNTLAATDGKEKANYLFGQKIAAVRELAKRDLSANGTRRLKYPQRVIDLLDRFQPYADLRSCLAHSVQTIAFASDGEQVFMFEPIGRSRALAVALTEASQQRVLKEVSLLAKQLNDQRVREPH
jgi:hypothetical protein